MAQARFGYKQVLHRTWGQFEAFMASFGALYVVGGVRILYSVGISSGGPAALWSSMLVTIVFMLITAASLAEICSSIPLSGSIYIWAAEAAGPKHGESTLPLVILMLTHFPGRFWGFVVAFWVTTAWTSFVASNTQATTNFLLSEVTAFSAMFPTDVDYSSVTFRAVVWACSECFLLLAILTNLMPRESHPAQTDWY